MRRFVNLLFAAVVCLVAPAHASDWVYTVVDGDNLWTFSERYLGSPRYFRKLQRLNNIEFPRRMKPGTRIRVPMKWLRSNPVQAVVAGVTGNVRIVRQDGKQSGPATTGSQLGLGDVLQTSHDSSAAIRFADESIVTLHQSSEMRFDHLSAHGETGMVDSRMRLLKGRLDTRVTPAAGPGSRFEIHTPSAISAVRGTRYRAAVDEAQKASSFEVLGGRVAVSKERSTRLLKGGLGIRVDTDGKISKPKPLLPAPILEPYPRPVRKFNDSLHWQAVAGAIGYKIEIGAGATLDTIAWERQSTSPKTTLPDLPDGEYLFRVRAIDGDGLQGKDRVGKLLLDTHPRPPVPLQPANGRIIRGEPAELAWTASADAHRYTLQIATDRDFNAMVSTQSDLRSPRFTALGIQEPGSYYWRVISVAEDGEQGPPGISRHWVQKLKPERVDASVSEGDGRLHASWPASESAAKYQVQLALDSRFETFEFDSLIDEARVSFEPTPGQVRYLRVRIVEEDGYLGPWGVVQKVDPPADKSAWLIPLLMVLGVIVL